MPNLNIITKYVQIAVPFIHIFFSDNACVCVAKFEINDVSDSKTCLNNITELITY